MEFRVSTIRSGRILSAETRSELRCFQEMTGSGEARRVEEASSKCGRLSVPYGQLYILQRRCSQQCGQTDRQIVPGRDDDGQS